MVSLIPVALGFLVVAAAPAVDPATVGDGHDVAWTSIGPGGGGWIQSIAWAPDAADTLYVGCDVGGFYRSTDAGRHYQRTNAGLHDMFVERIAVSPADPQRIILGTESGIHLSVDGGRQWEWRRAGFPPLDAHRFSAPIGAVVFDPLRPQIVYAGIGRPRFRKDGAGALYRSADAGSTWTLWSTGQLPPTAIVNDLAIQPGQSQLLLAATDQGLFRSTDEGRTWTPSQAGLPHGTIERLAFAPSAPQTVYATLRTTARDDRPFDGGVFRSDDAGRSWREINGPGMAHRVGKTDQPRQMTSSLACLAVDPRNADVVYAGDQAWVSAGVYKTTDGGGHWQRVTRHRGPEANMDYGWIGQWGPAVECLSLSRQNPDRLAFGTSGHVFVSDDGGATWTQRYTEILPDGHFRGTGLEVTCQHDVVADPVRPQRLYLCYADIGLLISDDAGQTFRRSSAGMKYAGNCFALLVDPARPDTVWATTGQWERNAGDVCRSTDGGQSWQVVGRPDSGLPDGQVRQLVMDASSPPAARRLVASSRGNGIYESQDGGLNWRAITGDLPAAAAQQPRGLLLDPAQPQHLVVALDGPARKNGGLYETLDAGRSWKPSAVEPPPFATITGLAADPHKFTTLYVTARQTYDHEARRNHPGGLFRSTDGGRTWTQLVTHRFVQAFAVAPHDGQWLALGTTDHPFHDDFVTEGVLVSRDGGQSWTREVAGLSHRNIACLRFSPQPGTPLLMGTSGNGAFVGQFKPPAQ